VSSAYVQDLNRAVERDQALWEEKKRADVQAVRDRLKPSLISLQDRLRRHLATIPVDIQMEGLSLAALQMSLRGRSRGHCHPGELGTALRKLGFKRRRRWDDDAGFRALWYPDR
jgi:hypothetical protein